MPRTSLLSVLGALALAACAEPDARRVADPTDMGEDVAPICATPRVAAWTGTASRVQENYPDDLAVTVTWRHADSTGCVDRYLPTGTAQYHYAIPGAQCSQMIAPGDHAVGDGDGELVIDRTTAPATYRGRGATSWQVTFTCTFEDGTAETQEFAGGGVWLEAAAPIAGARIEGERVLDDGSVCGRGHAGTPCTYAWSFDPAP